MKVLENLENYDIPSGFHLTLEQEDQLAADVKDIVNALIPIRESKLKTRKYFNSHLRYSSNVNEYLALPDTPKDKYAFGESYKPLPGEYTWYSEVLHPILLHVLSIDEGTFGYACNLINEDMEKRDKVGHHFWFRYSDAVVKFCNRFDIDEIRKKAKDIKDLADRMRFLNGEETEIKLFNSLTNDEEEYILSPTLSAISTLQKEVTDEISLVLQKAALDESKKKTKKASSAQNNQRSDRFNPWSGMLYDLSFLKDEKYKDMGLPVPENWDGYGDRNKNAFTAVLDYMFAHCYDTAGKLQKDEVLFDFVPDFMGKLMDSFDTELKNRKNVSDRDRIRKFADWILTTSELVNAAYEARPILYSDDGPYYIGNGFEEEPSQETTPFKLAIMKDAWGLTQFFVNELGPLLNDELKGEMPYNMWGKDFAVLSQKYNGKFGLEFEKRAVVDVEDNTRLLLRTLDNHCIEFSLKVNAEKDLGNPAAVFNEYYHIIDDLFHSMFRDYLERMQRLTTDKQELDDAMLNWLVSLQDNIDSHYSDDGLILERKLTGVNGADVKCFAFMRDICSTIAYEMTVTYFKDFEKKDISRRHGLALVAGSREEKTVDATNTHTGTQPQPSSQEAPKQPKAHNKAIDYERLYNTWNRIAFVNTSLEEFTHAIDCADFENMLRIAKEAGDKTGYIGCVKYIMKSLKISLGAKWYSAACASIEETPDSINKLNDCTNKIKKIDTDIIDECIK